MRLSGLSGATMGTKIYGGSDKEIEAVVRVLAEGGIVAVPTETVYGLAAHALDTSACRRIFEIKRRPLIDPLIVHLFDLEGVARLAHLNSTVETLAKAFWPGPLTLVLPKKRRVPDLITANLDTVAVRMPRHPQLRKVLQLSQLPLAAPSANPFGYVSPTRPEHILESLGDKVEHLLDGGPCKIGVESTIVDLRNPKTPLLLRPGAITASMLAHALKTPVRLRPAEKGRQEFEGLAAPGLWHRHYSPKTELVLWEATRMGDLQPSDKAAIIFFKRSVHPHLPKAVTPFWLTEGGDLEEAARRVFHILQKVDRQNFGTIYVELAPERGLGVAINDRLRRAAALRRPSQLAFGFNCTLRL